jgi:zinc transporter, ZIP family
LHAAGWSVISSLHQPILVLPAFVFVAAFAGLLPAGLGFAGGAMLWRVAAEVLPDALETGSRRAVALSAMVSTGVLVALQLLLLTV